MLLGVEVSREVHLLLANSGRRPRTGLELVVLPANAVVGSGVLFFRDLAVDLDHGALDVSDVLLLCQSTEGTRRNARLVRRQKYAGASGVNLVARIADISDAGDVDGAAAADDGVLEVFPEASLVMESDFTGRRVVEAVDCAGEERGILRHGVPEADSAEGYRHDGVVEFHRLRLDAEKVLTAVFDRNFLSALVECHALNCSLENGAVQHLRTKRARQVRETLVNCTPLRGHEVDAFVEPVR